MALPDSGVVVNARPLQSVLRRTWKRALRRLGWPGIAGAALLIAALTLAALEPALQHAADDARAALEQRRLELEHAPPPPPSPPSAQEIARRYVAGFPTIDQNASDMERLFASAERAKIALDKGDYAVKADPSSPFVTYTVTLPVHDQYTALKEFSASVLRDNPHAALDELRMRRAEATETDVQSTVRFTFAYRRP